MCFFALTGRNDWTGALLAQIHSIHSLFLNAWKVVIIRNALSCKYDQQYVLFSVPQKDDEIARLRKELESSKPRGRAVNTQKSSALEQVRTYVRSVYVSRISRVFKVIP